MKTIISKTLNIKFRRKKFLTERYQIDYIIYIV
nr:MAG TPA: fatty acid synthase subunit beta [Caudoviricetes sp.]